MRISLLGKNTEHERLYLHEALVRLAEGHHPASWYYLIWLTARGIPNGLMPDQDGLAGIPGQDENPIHSCIRRWLLSRADGCIVVMDGKQNFQGSLVRSSSSYLLHVIQACQL